MQISKEIFLRAKSRLRRLRYGRACGRSLAVKRRALTGRFAPLRARLLRRILYGFQVFGTKTDGKFAAEILAAAIGTAS